MKNIENTIDSSGIENPEKNLEAIKSKESLETSLAKYLSEIEAERLYFDDLKMGAEKDIHNVDSSASFNDTEREEMATIETLAEQEKSTAAEALHELGSNTNEEIKPSEKKPLEPGDEVYNEGNLYKVYNIHTPTVEEEQQKWKEGEIDRDKEFQKMSKRLPFVEGSDRFFQEGKLFDEQKKKELKENGPEITAIIEGGEKTIELDTRNAIKVETPEQREKIVKMQKETDEAEMRAANYMGMGETKKAVDKITGQPGKF
jgi:hypothetical protein